MTVTCAYCGDRMVLTKQSQAELERVCRDLEMPFPPDGIICGECRQILERMNKAQLN